ncbi:hypothetical protein TIFTF001_001888 [Ficus carica]|uniref:tRNA-uridine aminocarboxypropyltransferase n=1 Tax=Ficus carica TaxID=3494 RepID=A0AA87Z8D6_FICCA|nr:hypothetical protein TIFTF001_001888 [Ficus carica]
MVSILRTLAFFKCPPPSSAAFSRKTHMEMDSSQPRKTLISTYASRSPREAQLCDGGSGEEEEEEGSLNLITLQEWHGWGITSPVPMAVTRIVEDLKSLERNIDAQMSFGGNGGKLQGTFKIQEDKKHRATYEALGDSEQKLQFFSARQIACRLLGSRGYLCQKCWLPYEDCMCSRVTPCKLWNGVRFWLYMHPKDFLRQNNTGKLLWQVFGVQAATLCIFGIDEPEEIMWNAFKHAGKDKVWCLYPNKNAVVKSVQEAFSEGYSVNLESTETTLRSPVTTLCDLLVGCVVTFLQGQSFKGCREEETNRDETLNFVLIDGTWSNSAAMFRRLKDRAKSVWGEEDFPCISLNMGASAMHKLRPQPSWDRTCTAAAAIGLLSELQLLPQFSSCGLDKQADAIEDALVVLLDALTTRRLRMGRSITRKMRHTSDIC